MHDVTALAKGLIAGGLDPGDTVAVMSGTSYEWTLVDFAIWFAGGITVPIYETSSASQVEWILHDSGARRIFVQDRAKEIWSSGVLAASTLLADTLVTVVRMDYDGDAPNLASLAAAGSGVRDAELERHRSDGGPCRRRLTRLHLRHHRQAQGLRDHPRQLCPGGHGTSSRSCPSCSGRHGARTLMFLPLAHVLARAVQVVCLSAGVTLGHTAGARGCWQTWAPSSPRSCWWCRASSKRSTPAPRHKAALTR